ncbi:MAG: GH3 auxin-responsive promoter family protein [Burkholderiales bacterium]
MNRVLPYLWYPLFFAAAIAGFGALLAAGFSPVGAAYPPIILAGMAILLLEWKFPERMDWRPRWADVRADAAFMAVVQVVVPRALAAVALIAVAGWQHDPQAGVWPHHWPLAGQVLAMVLGVDFLRYWLHRACHTVDPLWKLHEVHHSPDILYTLNVGRFHPLEKTLHFSLDTIPFLLLGVAPEVVAGYFLAYSVNGFFQHSNIKLRYGLLNYLVGSAETHRWHHARDPRTAQCNFGNTVIIWDLLFGTWYLPKDGRVLDIGITDRAYPKGFLDQMAAPFRRRGGAPTRTLMRWLADTLVALRLRAIRRVEGMRLAATLRDPMRAQHRLLARLLRENRDTTFGRQYGFAHMRSCEDYTARVPVADFEALRPYVEAEIERGESALTRDPPTQYVRTSGSTGRPKDIPMVDAHLRLLRQIHRTAVACQYRVCPQAFSGSILAIVSPRHEGVLANGRPFGSASGIVSGNTPRLVREKFVLPQEVLTVADSRVKYLLILRIAIAQEDITYIGSANPTTLLTLIKLYVEHQKELIDDVRQGTFFLADRLTDDVRAAIRGRLHASPRRADELMRLQQSATPPRVADLWPALRGVMMWTCGSAGVAVAAVRRELHPETRILELGYLSSEFRGTITIGRRPGSGLPTLHAHFFEFVERDRWERGEPEFLTLDRLRKGVDYYIVVTTPSGLYRYFINDVVRVTGMLHRTPLLKFMQKGKGVTNITGEKLYEAQVLAAVQGAAAAGGRAVRFVMMLADERARDYRLYVETDAGPRPAAGAFGAAVDARLQALNVEYSAKRESERLGPLRASWLVPDTGEAYKQFCIGQGQREGQFKSVALAYAREFAFDLDARVGRD